MTSSPEEIYQLYQNFRNKYENIRNAGNVKNILMSVLQGDDAAAVGRLFQIDNYSITGYISNYIKELQGQYYKQRWYIYSDDSGSKVLCDYKPKAEGGQNDKWNGWLRFISPRDNEYCHVLTSSEMASAKTESERLAGWNQAKVDKYNKEHPEHHATITYVLQHENRRESYQHGCIFESLGYRVVKLDRVQFAGLTKKNVRRGDWRFLTEKEVDMLRMGAFE